MWYNRYSCLSGWNQTWKWFFLSTQTQSDGWRVLVQQKSLQIFWLCPCRSAAFLYMRSQSLRLRAPGWVPLPPSSWRKVNKFLCCRGWLYKERLKHTSLQTALVCSERCITLRPAWQWSRTTPACGKPIWKLKSADAAPHHPASRN